MHDNAKARHISQCLELAILLEASTHKPGNISVVTNFENTRYEHFLASAVAVSPAFESAAKKGIAVAQRKIDASDVGVGHLIRSCVAEIDRWQKGGNTLLGTVILLVPIAAGAGMTPAQEDLNILLLRKNLKLIVESTTPTDAINLYQAMEIAKPSGLGKAPDLDINDPASKKKIINEHIPLYKVFKIAEKYDTICSEWVNNYPLTFDTAYHYLVKQIDKAKDLNVAITNTFLKVLAEYPDTFIARKVGIEKAREVSTRANQVLELGALETTLGKQSLREFDLELRKSGNLLNPGTTADIVAAALTLIVLGGYRP